MPGLLDIELAPERVDVRGTKVEVYGVSVRGIAQLLGRFPILLDLFTEKDVSPEALYEAGGECVVAVIAAGCGYPGSKEHEEVADKLDPESQMALLAAILTMTFPKGLAPFIEHLEKMGGALGLGALPKGQATKSQKGSKP